MPPKKDGKKAPEPVSTGQLSQMEELFPVWDQATIDAEIKAIPVSKTGEYSGPKFEDVDGTIIPEKVAPFLDAWKRPEELVMGQSNVKMVQLKEEEVDPKAKVKKDPKKAADEPPVRDLVDGAILATGNDAVEWLLSTMLMVKDAAKVVDKGDFLWELISPKGPDGLPAPSPSGKYWIRLYVMDTWRSVTVDDRMPVDLFGRPLLVNTTRPVMLWPLLLSKAVFKLMNAFKCLEKTSPHEVPAFLWLTGWMRENLIMKTGGGLLYD
eukprot:gene20311-24322_t